MLHVQLAGGGPVHLVYRGEGNLTAGQLSLLYDIHYDDVTLGLTRGLSSTVEIPKGSRTLLDICLIKYKVSMKLIIINLSRICSVRYMLFL